MSTAPSITLVQFMEEQRLFVDSELERILPHGGEYPTSIHHAMRHSVFAGGKRLRPILCLEGGRLFHGDEKRILHGPKIIDLDDILMGE